MKLSRALREMGENPAPAVELTIDTESLLTAADEIDALLEALEDIQKRLRTILDTTSL